MNSKTSQAGYEFAKHGASDDPQSHDGPVDLRKPLDEIPTEDYLTLQRDGVANPDARDYWHGYNLYWCDVDARKPENVRLINRMLRSQFAGCRNIRHGKDGAVACTVDRMPNTNQGGRIFAGWNTDLMNEAKRREREDEN